MKKKKLEGKVAVISGGSSGIGYAIAKRLKEQGVRVFNISRSKFSDECFEESFSCDITDGEKLKETASQIEKTVGKIDMLFCNAGMGIAGKIENATLDAIDKIMNVNLTSQIKMTNIFLPILNDGGKIFYTGSLAAILPLPYQACYSSTKAGLLTFARALRTELKSRKISVTTFLPTDTKTGFTDARIKSKKVDEKEQHGIMKMEKEERNGKTPDYTAKRVLKLVKKKKPPIYTTTGGYGCLPGWMIIFLLKVLPTKFVDWLIEKLYL